MREKVKNAWIFNKSFNNFLKNPRISWDTRHRFSAPTRGTALDTHDLAATATIQVVPFFEPHFFDNSSTA